MGSPVRSDCATKENTERTSDIYGNRCLSCVLNGKICPKDERTKFGFMTLVSRRKLVRHSSSSSASALASFPDHQKARSQEKESTRHTCANTAIISCCMSVNLLYSSYGQWPRTLPSHLAHPAISFKSRSWITTSNKLSRKELAHPGAPALLSSFAEGVFVIQADIRKVYILDSDVMDLEQPSRTALRADLAGRIITMKDAAEPNFGLAEIVQEYYNETHQS